MYFWRPDLFCRKITSAVCVIVTDDKCIGRHRFNLGKRLFVSLPCLSALLALNLVRIVLTNTESLNQLLPRQSFGGFVFFFFKDYFREPTAGGGRRKSPKQTPHRVQSLRRGSVAEPQDHNLSWIPEMDVESAAPLTQPRTAWFISVCVRFPDSHLTRRQRDCPWPEASSSAKWPLFLPQMSVLTKHNDTTSW